MDAARLRITDVKRPVRPVPIGTGSEVAMKRENVIHEVQREFLHVGFSALASHEFRPRFR